MCNNKKKYVSPKIITDNIKLENILSVSNDHDLGQDDFFDNLIKKGL